MKWFFRFPYGDQPKSPSMRREWIEIPQCRWRRILQASPSMRREWIEIKEVEKSDIVNRVSLHAEGVD